MFQNHFNSLLTILIVYSDVSYKNIQIHRKGNVPNFSYVGAQIQWNRINQIQSLSLQLWSFINTEYNEREKVSSSKIDLPILMQRCWQAIWKKKKINILTSTLFFFHSLTNSERNWNQRGFYPSLGWWPLFFFYFFHVPLCTKNQNLVFISPFFRDKLYLEDHTQFSINCGGLMTAKQLLIISCNCTQRFTDSFCVPSVLV